MSNLTDRLRTNASYKTKQMMQYDCAEAADEIERLTAERDAALQASKWESDLCGQALEDRQASETKYAAACDEIDRLRVTNKMLMDDKAALLERVAGLERDAARYRWLRDKFSRIGVNVNPGWDAEQSATTKIESLWVMEHFRPTDPESTDAAIDAALKGVEQ